MGNLKHDPHRKSLLAKQYRQKNATRIKAYYKKNAARIKACQEKYRKKNATRIKAWQEEYRKRNAEEIRHKRLKRYHTDTKYRKSILAKQKLYGKTNAAKIRERRRIRQTTPHYREVQRAYAKRNAERIRNRHRAYCKTRYQQYPAFRAGVKKRSKRWAQSEKGKIAACRKRKTAGYLASQRKWARSEKGKACLRKKRLRHLEQSKAKERRNRWKRLLKATNEIVAMLEEVYQLKRQLGIGQGLTTRYQKNLLKTTSGLRGSGKGRKIGG